MERHVEAILSEIFGEGRPTRWVTRERPKIDRIACPWLIRRFIDAGAVFLFAPKAAVFETAARQGAEAFDIPGAAFSHVGERCSFDAFIERFRLDDPGLLRLAPIVRGADTDRHDLAPEAAGLHAISVGLASLHDDDQRLLAEGMRLYDALHAFASSPGEVHTWRPL